MTRQITQKLLPQHQQVMDEWFLNGFNKIKAVKVFNPDLTYAGLNALATMIFKKEVNKAYIKEKQDYLRANSFVSNELLLKEYIGLAYADITDFIGLTKEEIKTLPPEIRRCLSDFKITTKSYVNRSGETVQEEIMTFKLNDKKAFFEMINKHVGFYAEDNAQKTPILNFENASKEDLNVVLRLLEEQKRLKS